MTALNPCCICREEMEPQQRIKDLTCGHNLHLLCFEALIEHAIQSNKPLFLATCSLCRTVTDLSGENVQNLTLNALKEKVITTAQERLGLVGESGRLALQAKITQYQQSTTESLIQNREFLLEAFAYNFRVLKYAHPDLLKDPQFIDNAIKINRCALEDASDDLRQDLNRIFEIFQTQPEVIIYAHKNVRQNREFCLKLVKLHGSIIQYLSGELKNDEEIIIAAIENDIEAIRHIHSEARKNPKVFLHAIGIDPSTLNYADISLLDDLEFMLEAISINPDVGLRASNAVWNNPRFKKAMLEKQINVIAPNTLFRGTEFFKNLLLSLIEKLTSPITQFFTWAFGTRNAPN